MRREKFVELVEAVMSDEEPVVVTLDIRSLWILVSAVQLASRHPGVSRVLKGDFRRICAAFEDGVVSRHPEARRAFDHGWDSRFDVHVDDM